MPAVPPPTSHPTWKQAWDSALYGADGFFRREAPGDHFRTSVHASPLFAEALVAMTRAAGLDTVVDIGAGGGELLTAMRRLDPGLDLLGVEVAPRPAGLDRSVAWTTALPDAVEGLVVANEWLDNIPCHVVEVDPDGVPRVVHVDPASGRETLGSALSSSSVPASLQQWLDRWWPLDGRETGARAEVGTSRDTAWADVVHRVTRGIAVAVDYGHTLDTRPPFGSLRSYRGGRQVDVLPDASRDVTASVAVDAVASRVGAAVRRQRDVLHELGVRGGRPERSLADTDPASYLRTLASATEAVELTADDGLGAFWWVVTTRP
ncbi:MAG TPA: SAM-dependent methyltransferase [Nocardioidaceae bacterium]|nr:SAM-dependent methyltransferase [Nocardioidaceae bacterium]